MNASRLDLSGGTPPRVWRPLICALALAWTAGCRDEAAAAAAASQWRADSARYAAALAKYIRDSLVIDSIARTINTTRLRQLYRQQLHAEQPVVLQAEILCERTRLATRHGLMPSEAAIRDMKAALWRPEERDAVRAMEERFPKTAVIGAHPSCRAGPAAPEELNGTPLRSLILRPIPPRRPRNVRP
jgi:hypothetical protein